MQQPHQKSTLKDIPFGTLIFHYLHLLWRWKFFILILFPGVTAAAVFGIFTFGNPKPTLTATTIIGIDKPSSSIDQFFLDTPEGSSLTVMLTSRETINAVVQQLSLNLILPPPLERHQVFDSLHVDSTAVLGEYSFEIDQDNGVVYRVYFTNKSRNIIRKLVTTGRLTSQNVIPLPGISFILTKSFLAHPQDITFYITSRRKAADGLLARINTTNPDPRRGINHIGLTVEGHDYRLIARTANAIAREFIARNLHSKQRRLNRVIEVLRTKLENTRSTLNSSRGAFDSFMSRNPSVTLSNNTEMIVTELGRLKSLKHTSENNVEKARELKKEYASVSVTRRNETTAAILQFLSYHDNARASVLQSSLNEALQRREEIRNTYSSTHPVVRENTTRINTIGQQAINELNDYIRETAQEITRISSEIDSYTAQMRQLPRKQLHRAQLESEYQTRNEIVNEIRTQYNQALSERETIVPDVFIMENAVAPLPPSDFMNTLKLLGVAVAAGFGCAFAPPIFFNMIDKTARTEFELKRLTSLPCLGSVPRIPYKKGRGT